MARRVNAQMFALPHSPAEVLSVGGVEYGLERVFKHDFWAATCLYVSSDAKARFPRVVVKFGRSQGFAGVPLVWSGKLLADHEQAIYDRLAGLAGVPAWVGRVSPTCYAIEYIDAKPLDHVETLPRGFFDDLRKLFDAIHARGVAYGDANKRSNILVTREGKVALVDYQISLASRDDWPWPMRQLAQRCVAYLAAKDIYHLYKHKRRLAGDELTAEEEVLSRDRSGLHKLHRKLTKPYRAARRAFLQRQFSTGRLLSPSAGLEDHHQPEKETWQKQ